MVPPAQDFVRLKVGTRVSSQGPGVTSQASHKSQCPLFSIVLWGLHQSCRLVCVLAKIPRGSLHAQRHIGRAGNDTRSLSSVKEVVPTHQGSPTPSAIPVSRDFCREVAGPPGTHRLSPAGTPSSRHEGGQRSVRSVLKSEIMLDLEATRDVFKVYEIQRQSI